jgi:hypothetical protein
MANHKEHKFTYTVSGVELSEAQRHKISAAIATAVAHSLGEGTTHAIRADALNVGRINGGLWIDVLEIERAGGLQAVLKSPAVTGAARE